MSKIFIPLFAFLFFSKTLAAQVDTVSPTIVCKNLVTVNIGPLCFIHLAASDFVDTVSDDNLLPPELGVRKVCTGTGFPEDNFIVSFSVSELGIGEVEVWARDAGGNSVSCSALVTIQNPAGNCDPTCAILVQTPAQQGIKEVALEVKGGNCKGDSFAIAPNFIVTAQNGYGGGFCSFSWPGYNTLVTPSKNTNPLNGVSTYDLVLISKHILGIEALDSPWKRIAADANQDGKITTFDIVTLRKLILGITNELPNGKSWRFVPHDYVFPDPLNPFLPPFPERAEVPNAADPVPSFFQFVGVKIGDVNFSADPEQ